MTSSKKITLIYLSLIIMNYISKYLDSYFRLMIDACKKKNLINFLNLKNYLYNIVTTLIDKVYSNNIN